VGVLLGYVYSGSVVVFPVIDEINISMHLVVTWSELEALIELYYPKAGNGRQPVGLTIMLRFYFLQHRLNLSDRPHCAALLELIWGVRQRPARA
jgi:hypothetical protein